MATTAEPEINAEDKKTGSKLWLILSTLLCLLGGGLGFYGVWSGTIPMPGSQPDETMPAEVEDLPDIAFVSIPTIIVTLPPNAKNDHLRFSGQIEVPADYREDVEFLMPRILDLMNGYLRALTAEDIEGPGALFRIRLHLFRRIVMVVGLGKANGLLVTEFILN
ncbi:flagellar basal body-associated FliL family protein [Marivita sp. GX14005]|uniref:flagellar basal body-associated FliL family protein n=1 Tax=Marivita sp. GX14005 TaxID=2942276 RepID=UPI00201979C5|nr:flagellar basal body-associated FliL family protein [Marivita sp. GX14005]MCL3881835.1 flagellar basal body-associated FliL family protein [Marivita sp. GX14005]